MHIIKNPAPYPTGAGYQSDSEKKLPIKPIKQRMQHNREIILNALSLIPKNRKRKAQPMNKPQAV